MFLTYNGDKHKTFTIWLAAMHNQIFTSEGRIKCVECNGSGWVYDPMSKPDCYEGNKMRGSIPCPKCRGAKTFELTEENLKPFQKKFSTAEKNWREDRLRENAEKNRRQRIQNKLLSVLMEEEMKQVKII